MKRTSAPANESRVSHLSGSRFKPQDYERPGVFPQEITEIKQAFDLFDPQNTGVVSTNQLLASLDSLGLESRNQPLYMMIQDKLYDNVNEMQFEQFLDMMTNRVSTKDTKRDIRKIFCLFDEDKTGFISVNSLKKVVKDLGQNIQDSQLRQMIEKADVDKDGVVSEDEFYMIMTRKQKKQRKNSDL